jgi:DNA-binding CsgD family transcriptional regulator
MIGGLVEFCCPAEPARAILPLFVTRRGVRTAVTGSTLLLSPALADAVAQQAHVGELAEALSRAIGRTVAHDGLCLACTSPSAGLRFASFSFWNGQVPSFGGALASECCPGGGQDRARAPAIAVTGDLRGSREQRLLQVNGIGSGMRLTLRTARGAWGWLALLRAGGGGRPFGPGDLVRLTALGPALVDFARDYVTAGPLVPTIPAMAPGVVIIGGDRQPRRATAQARWWRDQVACHHAIPDWANGAFLSTLADRARQQARDPRLPPPSVVGPAASYGRWMQWQAQALGPDADSEVAVVIQPATGAALLPSFCDWYGITARERQVVSHLCEGTAPKQLARRLDMSLHTVNDHLKSMFRKTGVNGRSELLAALTS